MFNNYFFGPCGPGSLPVKWFCGWAPVPSYRSYHERTRQRRRLPRETFSESDQKIAQRWWFLNKKQQFHKFILSDFLVLSVNLVPVQRDAFFLNCPKVEPDCNLKRNTNKRLCFDQPGSVNSGQPISITDSITTYKESAAGNLLLKRQHFRSHGSEFKLILCFSGTSDKPPAFWARSSLTSSLTSNADSIFRPCGAFWISIQKSHLMHLRWEFKNFCCRWESHR